MIHVDFIISINVHEKPDFFIKQYKNILEYVDSKFVIILNCNKFMFNELKNIDFNNNVILNPHIIEKKHGNGTLFYGIYSNMMFANTNYIYKYFIVLSSRNIFYNKINSSSLLNMSKIKGDYVNNANLNTWGWPLISKSLLFKKYKNINGFLSCSAHEGMTFDYNTTNIIIDYLKNNIDIFNELIVFNNGVEEWALQIISINESDGYYDIGNGVDTHNNSTNLPIDKFTHKIPRS